MFLGMSLEQLITAVARCVHLIRIILGTYLGEVVPNIMRFCTRCYVLEP
jgi:hypothetical protein